MTNPVEQAFGYVFKDKRLLDEALTHCSILTAPNNERLEFLGDAVLGEVAAHLLFVAHPDWSEGELTTARTELVRGATLAKLAHEMHLGEHIQKLDATALSERMLASAVEAVLGAILIDGGHAPAQKAVEKLVGKLAEETSMASFNAKGALQELLQPAIPAEAIIYQPLEETGPAHERIYTVGLYIGKSSSTLAIGEGSTKKAAENAAAAKALKILKSDRQRLKKITNSYPQSL
jgi:ribonuclease III